ncbi:hypothetical protein UFOVP753_38 [uncultured Caudovirales phage]|uniref:Uncharacterized protein n=1 Tax=uncultured Caudovirales phage TaxID=2100421 RepID=A0A6J7X872_9CAUD|nr:hypothetical protein UFOVP753_38 [uncultured Caudovirales phage]
MNIKIPIGKKLLKIFWMRNNIFFIPTFSTYIHKGNGYVIAFIFLGLNIELWTYNIYKSN